MFDPAGEHIEAGWPDTNDMELTFLESLEKVVILEFLSQIKLFRDSNMVSGVILDAEHDADLDLTLSPAYRTINGFYSYF